MKEAIEYCRFYPSIPRVEQILKKRDRHASFESAYSEVFKSKYLICAEIYGKLKISAFRSDIT